MAKVKTQDWLHRIHVQGCHFRIRTVGIAALHITGLILAISAGIGFLSHCSVVVVYQ